MLAYSIWAWVGIAVAAVVAATLIFLFFCECMVVRLNKLSFLTPFRIHLLPAPDTSWTTEPAAVALSDQLRQLGFVEVGVFEIPEMPQAKLHGFVHEPTDVIARIYNLRGKF